MNISCQSFIFIKSPPRVYPVCLLLTAIHVTKIIESLLFALTVYTAGVVPPVILGFYKDKFRLNKYGAMAGLLIGCSSALILKYMMLNRYLIYIFPVVCVMIFLVSWLIDDKN